MKLESNYIFNSRKVLCKKILSQKELLESDRLEFFLAIHLVLEIGINTFFRNYYNILTVLDRLKYNNEIDQIGFIDKVRFFLISNKFTFKDGRDAEISNDISETLFDDLIQFTKIRNMIMHGHSVSETSGAVNRTSKLKSKIKDQKYMNEQIEKFKKIIYSLNYFLDRVETSINREQIISLQKTFLDTDFLNIIKSAMQNL